jgi:hypothetical protein
VISKKSTPIAVLRDALGYYEGREDVFAATVQCSVSWVKKASAGLRTITPQTARKVSLATGVCEEWLLKGDPKSPMIERDRVTPYTLESYERWRRDNLASNGDTPLPGLKTDESATAATLDPRSVAMLTAEVVRTVFAALESGKGNLAVNDLWKYSKVMTRRYGAPRQGEASEDFTRLVGELMIEAVYAEGYRRSLRGDI